MCREGYGGCRDYIPAAGSEDGARMPRSILLGWNAARRLLGLIKKASCHSKVGCDKLNKCPVNPNKSVLNKAENGISITPNKPFRRITEYL